MGFEPTTACLEGRYSTNLIYFHSMVPFLCTALWTPSVTIWG